MRINPIKLQLGYRCNKCILLVYMQGIPKTLKYIPKNTTRDSVSTAWNLGISAFTSYPKVSKINSSSINQSYTHKRQVRQPEKYSEGHNVR